ncbi:permease [Desmonostoc muscorum CCALA 125]|nr:permease [Desmonostoc muscorum CCALA 125]
MDWVSVWLDIALGLVIAGALAAWVSNDFWQAFFLTDHPIWSKLWGPIVGPIVAIFSFVCSVGNVPLAPVLWNGGISFGGVVAFIFADLIILPILNIYRKYYSLKVSIFLAIAFYAAMVSAALIIEVMFQILGLIPQEHNAKVVEASIQFNYTTVLNILFLALAGLLVARFFKTGGPNMLKMMNNGSEQEHSEHHNMMHYAMKKRRNKSVSNLPTYLFKKLGNS